MSSRGPAWQNHAHLRFSSYEPRRGILDSGGVLIRPRGGRWFPPPAFHDVLTERGVTWQPALLDQALAAGGDYLDEVHPVPLADERAERPVWLRYYELVLDRVGVTTGAGDLAEAITTRWESTISVELYPWTVSVLAELEQRGIPVVVLSDAWPSLRRWYRELSLDRYIAAMVISGEEGVTKPDHRAFDKARELLGSDVSEVIFVDDYPGHVRGAVDLGMRGLRLRHGDEEPAADVHEITDLTELLALLERE
jgi:putative hydrolase of the HAD superfamily